MNRLLRKTVIAGNWKMNNTPAQANALIEQIKQVSVNKKACDIVICVPFTAIAEAVNAVRGTDIKIGAQNMHFAKSGAYTGEISAEMLSESGVEYVVIGHSERRQYFGETDETVNRKVKAAIEADLTVILCVGELEDQREKGITREILSMQTKTALFGVDKKQMGKVIIAYEPVWAIGTGKTASAYQANEACAMIRSTLGGIFGKAVADATTIQYGGSMNSTNASALLACDNVDGGLIGGASLEGDQFGRIIDAAQM